MCWLCFNNELPCYSSTVFWFLRPAQMVTKRTCKWIPINQHVQFKEFVFGWPNHSRNYWGTIFAVLAAFDASFCIDEHIVFSNFLFDSNPPFSHRHYYERIGNAYMNLFITFFFLFAGQKSFSMMNPCLWQSWYSCFFFLIYIYCSFIEMVCISN